MRPISMRVPGVEDLYIQRVSRDAHRKKLDRIRQQRKSHLGYDASRFTQITSFKESKNRSFINRFNKTSSLINKENVAFLGKLQRVRPSFSRYSQSDKDERKSSLSFITPHIKKCNNETEHENNRISTRMRSLSSSLNAEKMDRQYQKTQQIKRRLMRYVSTDSNKVSLKTERYLDLSCKLVQSSRHSARSMRGKKTTASHYNAEQISKNKVSTGSTLLKIKKRYNRPDTTTDQIHQNNISTDAGFFATQPAKQTRKRKPIEI